MFNFHKIFKFSEALVGRRCAICSVVLEEFGPGIILCDGCQNNLAQRLGGFCAMCGNVYALEDDATYLCTRCRTSPFSWSALSFYSVYQGLLKDIILRYKFSADLGLGQVLGNLLSAAAARHPYEFMDLIIPVPLHDLRLKHRGFNQSFELCRILGKKINLPVCRQALIKIRHTPAQSLMSRKERLENIKNVFHACPDTIKEKKILLVDDIMTTGSTLEECSKTLLGSGAAEVRVVVLARAV
ncbi:ComF family protein [Desulfonatronovibrio magnus]|uniref:ComF family protein n=1 Tax=Desulfonatronovibrio magnus TaxID=698827 RepID=UPI0005EBE625|nr:ComF family protein [Desulfonatronovibrio magnus]